MLHSSFSNEIHCISTFRPKRFIFHPFWMRILFLAAKSQRNEYPNEDKESHLFIKHSIYVSALRSSFAIYNAIARCALINYSTFIFPPGWNISANMQRFEIVSQSKIDAAVRSKAAHFMFEPNGGCDTYLSSLLACASSARSSFVTFTANAGKLSAKFVHKLKWKVQQVKVCVESFFLWATERMGDSNRLRTRLECKMGGWNGSALSLSLSLSLCVMSKTCLLSQYKCKYVHLPASWKCEAKKEKNTESITFI